MRRGCVILVPSVPPFLALGGERAGEQRAVLIHGVLSKGCHRSSALGPLRALSLALA